jgi:mitotic spindle assembly checkpoint protein MAD2
MSEASTSIDLRGSTEIVVEFFEYCVNSILYQRAIYPPESFKRTSKYGLAMMMATEEGLVAYIANITRQLESWLLGREWRYVREMGFQL